jgi:diguanylate cyclase (GGDEF)-like protein/PAS domain S-box-containing protein
VTEVSLESTADDFNSDGLLRLLADSLPALIAYYTLDGFRCRFANAAYAAAYQLDTVSIVGKTVGEIIGEEARATIQPHIDRVVRGEASRYERALTMPGGQHRVIEVRLQPRKSPQGEVLGAFVLINDITRHHEAEKVIRDSEERLAKFSEATTEGIIFSAGGLVIDCNDAAARMMRLTPQQAIGRNYADFIDPDSLELVLTHVRAAFERPYEATLRRSDGTRFAAELVGKEMIFAGKPCRLTVIRDISDRKQAEARIHFLAHHDTLTHLPNRAMLMDRLSVILAAARRNQTQVGVVFIDLDNFKTVNDSLGHYAGDALLKRVAQRLQSCLRGTDLVGRLGGDEFLAVISDVGSVEDIAAVVEKIAEAISEPFSIEDQPLAVSGSIGVSLFPRDGDTPDALVRNADAAMYLAKDNGRNNFQFFTPSLHKSAFQMLSMESGIRKAIKQIEFALHYQPEVATASGQPSMVEALIGWKHPELGLLGPDKFITVAEHRGLIMPIGRWVINEAMRQSRAWLDQGVRMPIAINLSAIQFKHKDLVDEIAARIADHGLTGDMIELELTESLFMEDVATVSRTLGRLKDLGVTLAVDDFGTGYSSLSYLKRYPIDKIKIDRSFVRDIPHDADDVAITMAIINLADSLGLKIVAEGVETEAQAAFLADHHCDFLQGYLISRPLPPDEALEWLKRRG